MKTKYRDIRVPCTVHHPPVFIISNLCKEERKKKERKEKNVNLFQVWEEVRRRTKMKYIRNGYGMTELSVISNLSDRSSTDDTVGPAIPGFQCKIVDPSTGRTLAVKEVGEVCFKGEQVMLGYFRNPKVTAETIDQDNWCHTGDLGYLNEKGLLYITGRIKELIKYKGFQVSPSEIEAVILSHPGVKDVAVVGKPDEVNGEIPVAFVVRQPGSNTVSAKDIVDFANGECDFSFVYNLISREEKQIGIGEFLNF